jgi:hypothetical protein
MNDASLPAARLRLTPAELEAMVFKLGEDVLRLKHRAGLPMPYIDKIIVEGIEQREAAEREAAQRRNAAFQEAKAEALRVGNNEPIDAFVRKLKRGEFDQYRQ